MSNFWPDVVAPSCLSIIRSTIEWLSVSNTKTSPIMPLCIMHYALCINAFHQQLTIVVNAFLPNHQVYGLWLEKRQLSNHWPKYHLDMSPIPQKGQLNAFFRVFDVVAERPLHEWVTFGQMSSRYEPIYSKPLWAAETVWARKKTWLDQEEESVMQKLIHLFYKRRSTLHQWMGGPEPWRIIPSHNWQGWWIDDRTHDTGALDTIGASKRKEFLTELKS